MLDLILVVVAVGAAVGGYRLGFLARVLSWIGLGLGLYFGARVLPRLLAALNLSTSTSRLTLALAVLIGGAFVGQAAGLLIGGRLHAVLPFGPVREIDRGVGAGVGVLGVVVALWLLLPSLASVPGWPARVTRQSAISQWVSGHLPLPPDAFTVLRRLVGQDAFPQVFDSLHPGEAVGAPPAGSPLSAAVTAQVQVSTVKVEGQACDRIEEGSGFAIGANLVVTNAHVVAGEPAGQTSVELISGQRLAATVVLFDPNRDLALLAVRGLGVPALTMATGTVGESGAVFGHPGGQAPLAIMPASVAQEITATGRDLYDRHDTRRDVFVLASTLAPGDSGGALVNAQGEVIGVAFAIAVDRPGTSYALTSRELQAVLATPSAPTGAATGACLTG